MKGIFSVLVENKDGVLSQISGLFARRAFNIDSLAGCDGTKGYFQYDHRFHRGPEDHRPD